MSSTVLDTKIKEKLNSTGIFLEAVAAEILGKTKKYKVRKEFGYSGNTSEKFEGTVDILGLTRLDERILLIAAVECKKANVEQKKWVFDFSERDEQEEHFFEYINSRQAAELIPYKGFSFAKLFPDDPFLQQTKIYTQSFEFNEQKGDLSRNQLERPYKAMLTANEVISSIVSSPINQLASILGSSHTYSLLPIPVVVTTAELAVLNYPRGRIDQVTGTLDVDEIDLIGKQWLLYDFPLAYHLRTKAKETPSSRPTFIVNSKNLNEFFDCLEKDLNTLISFR